MAEMEERKMLSCGSQDVDCLAVNRGVIGAVLVLTKLHSVAGRWFYFRALWGWNITKCGEPYGLRYA